MSEKVLITGAGVISAIGTGLDQTRTSLEEGRSGIGPVRHLKTHHPEFPVGEIGFSNEDLVRMLAIAPGADISRTSLLGIIALKEAIGRSGISSEDIQNAVLVSGTTVAGMDISEKHYPDFISGKSDNPEFLAKHSCGSSTETMADHTGGFRMCTTLSTACSSAANAIIFGANLIKSGQASIVAAGGSECLSDFHLCGFSSLMILDKERCRPFDESRAGLNLGEGAGFLILESQESAERRGSVPMAELSGYGNACDAFHQAGSSENGEGAFLAMSKALNMAGIKTSQVDYVNAHGTGTRNNDASESAAIRRIFGERIPAVSSTKQLTGHTTSSSGSIEAVFCLLCLNDGFIPPQTGWKNADPACIIPYTGGQPRKELLNVLCNSFGFGGNDSSLLFSKLAGR